MGELIGKFLFENGDEKKKTTSKMDMKEIHSKIKDYFKKNPKPSDDEVHELAEKMGINPHEFEQHIYMILGELLKGK